MVDEAKPDQPQPATPEGKPAAKPAGRPAGPAPAPLDNELLRRLRARFGEAIGEATLDRNQAILVVAPPALLAVGEYLKGEEKFDFLTDLTAVDWYGREKRFEVVLNLYSFPHNQRLRLKVPLREEEACPSVTRIWGAADWLRSCLANPAPADPTSSTPR